LLLTLRFDADESRTIAAAARVADMSMTRYIKQIALEAARAAQGAARA
jgi:uncharacterized protein (DUF1778 family)